MLSNDVGHAVTIPIHGGFSAGCFDTFHSLQWLSERSTAGLQSVAIDITTIFVCNTQLPVVLMPLDAPSPAAAQQTLLFYQSQISPARSGRSQRGLMVWLISEPAMGAGNQLLPVPAQVLGAAAGR